MVISTTIKNNVLNIAFNGELDEYTAGYTRNYLDDAIRNYNYEYVVFDMQNLEFMDSTGIGVLLGRYKLLKSKEKDIYISNPSPVIEKIINMSGIYEIMPKIS
jgi:stage II sporulation protein AA (anti-sigma F factor antagonist)